MLDLNDTCRLRNFNTIELGGSRWKRGRQSVEYGAKAMVVLHHKKKCGRKPKDYSQQLANLINIPLSDRTCFRSTSAATGIPMTCLHRIVKRGAVRRHSSAVKPVLTEPNKQLRIQYALNNINMDRHLFDSMMDDVHVDEKWFNMKQVNKTYFPAEGEAETHQIAKSKHFIYEVMFLAAVARPSFNTTWNSHFDGKLGIFPFTTMVPAQRSSRNRPAGTMVMKPMAVTKKVYCDFICNKVIPAIKDKWPLCHWSVDIKVQQDNAKPHLIRNHDPQLQTAVAAIGLNVTLVDQPPISPTATSLILATSMPSKACNTGSIPTQFQSF
jgi:hypothetical protein